MDLLQLALVFLIMLLGVFLSVVGIQVFLILKDLQNSLKKLDLFLDAIAGEKENGKVEVVSSNVKQKIEKVAESVKNNNKRFYKKILK